MKKSICLTLLICFMFTSPAFADVDDYISVASTKLEKHVEKTKKFTVGENYPIGTIYTTIEDIDADDMHDMMGGEWREIDSTFLWATDASDKTPIPTIINGDGEEITDTSLEAWMSNLHRFGGRGGNNLYRLVAGVAADENGYSFWTDDDTEYLGATNTFTGTSYTPGTIDSGVIVTDKTAEETQTVIMPPYTSVKMFEKVSGDDEDEEG